MNRFPYRKMEEHSPCQNEMFFQMWTDAFPHLTGEQWKRLS